MLFLATVAEQAGRERGVPLDERERGRLEQLYTQHHDVVWRVLRRTGFTAPQADDAAQQVFLVALRRLDDLQAGKERAFLCATALVVARKLRQRGTREEPVAEVPEQEDARRPDEETEHRRNVARLDAILQRLEPELRAVYVLQEIEGLSKRETALALDVPEGTVATRLRRARRRFDELLSAQLAGGAP